jgi:ABC-type microcin C transport system permease subunit YejB
MKKRLLVIAALLCLAVPTALAAPPAGKKPDAGTQAAPESAAEKACRAERGTSAASIAAFNEKYGTNKNKKNAFGKCVSSKSKGEDDEDEADEDKNKTNASKKCKTERGTTAASIAAFNEKYGTNKNQKNAFGKCVSKLSKQKA